MNTKQTLREYLTENADEYFDDEIGDVWLGKDLLGNMESDEESLADRQKVWDGRYKPVAAWGFVPARPQSQSHLIEGEVHLLEGRIYVWTNEDDPLVPMSLWQHPRRPETNDAQDDTENVG